MAGMVRYVWMLMNGEGPLLCGTFDFCALSANKGGVLLLIGWAPLAQIRWVRYCTLSSCTLGANKRCLLLLIRWVPLAQIRWVRYS